MNRLLVLVLTIILSIISTSGYAAEELFDTKTAEKHIEQGIAYLKAKNFDAAISEFDEASVILPDAEAYYFLGYAYYLKGRSGDYSVLELFDHPNANTRPLPRSDCAAKDGMKCRPRGLAVFCPASADGYCQFIASARLARIRRPQPRGGALLPRRPPSSA